jgi:O-antigen/teichoic acid export membrane protein
VPLRPSFDRARWGSMLRDTLAYAVATAVYALYFRVAVILVSLIAVEREVGYFGAAFRIVEVLVQIPSLAVTTVFPIFARAARDDVARLARAVERTFDTALVFGVWLGVALAVGAPFAIEVVAGSDFDGAVTPLRIQAVALAAAFVSQAFAFALLSLRRHRELLLIYGVALAVAAGLTAVLASTDGARGAAIAVAVGEVASAIVAGIAYLRAVRGAHISFALVPRVAVAAAAATGAALALGGHAALQAAVAAVCYFVVLLALRGIPEELLAELRRLRRTRGRA